MRLAEGFFSDDETERVASIWRSRVVFGWGEIGSLRAVLYFKISHRIKGRDSVQAGSL